MLEVRCLQRLLDLHLSHSHTVGLEQAFKRFHLKAFDAIAAPLLLEDGVVADPDLVVGAEQFRKRRRFVLEPLNLRAPSH
jgi:hypothetical protein